MRAGPWSAAPPPLNGCASAFRSRAYDPVAAHTNGMAAVSETERAAGACTAATVQIGVVRGHCVSTSGAGLRRCVRLVTRCELLRCTVTVQSLNEAVYALWVVFRGDSGPVLLLIMSPNEVPLRRHVPTKSERTRHGDTTRRREEIGLLLSTAYVSY